MLYRATNDTQKRSNKLGHYVSSIGYALSHDGIHFRRRKYPLISPTETYENGLGCEDARLSKIDGTYYIYYTSVEGAGDSKQVRIALATSNDLGKIKKYGAISPKNIRAKAAWLLPERIENEYILFYTLMADSPKSSIFAHRFKNKADIIDFVISTPSNEDTLVIGPDSEKTFRGPEFGAPLIKTQHGWLMIYCGSNNTDHREWTINAALLDIKNPVKVIAKLPEPILRPEIEAEIDGVVKNVTFPTGAILRNEELYVYYGSGDQGCCLATCDFNDLMDMLLANASRR